jgi:hypothetical protein
MQREKTRREAHKDCESASFGELHFFVSGDGEITEFGNTVAPVSAQRMMRIKRRRETIQSGVVDGKKVT